MTQAERIAEELMNFAAWYSTQSQFGWAAPICGTIQPGEAVSARRKKPDNIPTIYDMAVMIIRDRGNEFVEGQEIVAGIKARWWPDVTSNDVTPTLWRLANKDQRLRKDGTKYGLPIRAAIKVPLSQAS